MTAQTQPAQPEAQRLADCLERDCHMNWPDYDNQMSSAAELRRQHARIAELEAAICTQHKENQRLRRNWCISYAGALAYTDDGEAQDNGDLPTINFLRDPVPEIEDKIRRRGAKQLAQLRESKPQCEWTYKDEYFHWQTSCDNAYQFTDGGIKENSFTHCPYCGGGIGEKT